MKKLTVGYWIATALFCLGALAGGVMDLILADQIKEAMTHLGYPLYVARLLGVFKILGVIALLIPGFLLLKEWAYAGFCFELIGAIVSHVAVGDGIDLIAPPIVVFALGIASYLLRPENRRLASAPAIQGAAKASEEA